MITQTVFRNDVQKGAVAMISMTPHSRVLLHLLGGRMPRGFVGRGLVGRSPVLILELYAALKRRSSTAAVSRG